MPSGSGQGRGSGRPARSGRSHPGWLSGALAAALLCSAFYIGCQQPTRYRVLSFFFDGVPVPEELQAQHPDKIYGPDGLELDPDSPEAKRIVAARKRQGEQTQVVQATDVSVHAPYRDRNCFGCHIGGEDNLAPPADLNLCGRCHKGFRPTRADDWAHGPAALGQCNICHHPHKSGYEHLLVEPQPTMCLNCHTQPGLLDQPQHKPAVQAGKPCSSCHDPHLAGNRLLLVDAESYQRRKIESAAGGGSVHKPFAERRCAPCHKTEQSNALADNINQVCLQCHKDKTEPPPGVAVFHQAVRNDQCVTCHAPHNSPLPHLVRPTAEQICLACHKLAEIDNPRHPRVSRVDCTICHQGHSSQRPHLLRPGVFETAPADGKAGPAVQPGPTPDGTGSGQ